MMNTSSEELSPEAQSAWLAYQEMGESKKHYFGFLQELDQKYDKNASPSIAENLKLELLLKSHDEKVKAFNLAMANITDTDARTALVTKLSQDATASSSH